MARGGLESKDDLVHPAGNSISESGRVLFPVLSRLFHLKNSFFSGK
ncbi:MAG: hypothetical protein ACTSWN_05665 [Promethearchaeota archaeon]